MNYFKISRFFLYIIPLTVIVVLTSTLFPFIVGKYVLFRTLSALAFIFFLLGLLLDKKAELYTKRFKKIIKNPLFISVSAFVVIFVIACFFGVDPHFSFWSNFERGEGGLQMIHFLVFFITMIGVFKDKKHWHNMFWSFIISAVLMILYGVAAGVGINGFLGPQFGQNFSRFQGSIGNPAYVAVYLIFAIFFTLYILVSKFKKLSNIKKSFFASLIVIFLVFFVFAATRGAFLGLGAGFFAGLLYLGITKKAWRKPVFSILAILIILGSSGIYFKDSKFIKSLPGSRIFDISFKAKTFQHRTIMWGMAWEAFTEKPVLGWGPGAYLYIFQQKYDPAYFNPESKSYGAWFDRAHSVIFDYLSQTGILGFLLYINMFIVLFWQLAKFKAKKVIESPNINWSNSIKALFIFLPVAYLVQGLVLFDISTTYLSLFIFLGFALYKFNELKLEEKDIV